MNRNKAENELDNCLNENHKDATKLIITISWAVCAATMGFPIEPYICKYILFPSTFLFSASLISEFLAGLAFINSCELAKEGDTEAILYRKIGTCLQKIRNTCFLIGFIIFIIAIALKTYG